MWTFLKSLFLSVRNDGRQIVDSVFNEFEQLVSTLDDAIDLIDEEIAENTEEINHLKAENESLETSRAKAAGLKETIEDDFLNQGAT